MKRTLLFICTLLCANVLLAQPTVGDILIREGVKYRIISENEAEVYGPVDDRSSIDILSIVTWHYEVPGQGIWDEEYSVTSIGDGAFGERPQITSVNIPNSITSIGDGAFSYCRGLTSITIPNSVTSIGDYAFSYCSGLTSFTIPNSVTSIGDRAFRDCSSLTSITIPNSITSIGNSVFYECI
ncbi:MAG: leucine-rich repeat domain-containing protein [Bacteroidales bacterium]|nr:leucine-rich repeat domain-containing protein [Bacteroidales bacterium]